MDEEDKYIIYTGINRYYWACCRPDPYCSVVLFHTLWLETDSNNITLLNSRTVRWRVYLLNQINARQQVHAKINEFPMNSFFGVFFLFKNEHVMVEKLLKFLVGEINTKLLKTVELEFITNWLVLIDNTVWLRWVNFLPIMWNNSFVCLFVC